MHVALSLPQITIPSADTTYWCAGFRLPEEIRSSVRHVIKVNTTPRDRRYIVFVINVYIIQR